MANHPMTAAESISMDERVVLITGAAGGLGQALVNAFAASGWNVAAAHHQTQFHSSSKRIHPIAMDVTDRGRVAEVVKEVENRWGRIDALVNNAGVTADASLAKQSEENWDRVLGVNLTGAFLCSQAVLRGMSRRRQGHIINVSSFSGMAGAAGQANYSSSKAGLIGLTKSLAREMGSMQVCVNAILPGFLSTPMTKKLSETIRKAYVTANVLGRLGSVEEVARFIVFLAAMKNVSGQVFQLDSRVSAW